MFLFGVTFATFHIFVLFDHSGFWRSCLCSIRTVATCFRLFTFARKQYKLPALHFFLYILPVSVVLSHVQEGEINFAYVATRLGNLVPRLSLHCLPLPLGERPYLRLVTWLPRVRVVEKIIWGEGWHGILIIVVGFKTSSRYPLCRGFKQVLPMNATLFLPSPKYRKVLTTKKFRLRMEHKFSTIRICKTSRSCI